MAGVHASFTPRILHIPQVYNDESLVRLAFSAVI